jgi:thiamine biosynthesis lipoprotein
MFFRPHHLIAAIYWLSCVLLVIRAAAGSSPYESFTGQAMGTSYTVKIVDRPHEDSLQNIEALVRGEFERIEQIFSLYRADSELSRLNRAPANEWVTVSRDVVEVTAHAVRLAEQTGGTFDPTVGPLVQLWRIQDLSAAWQPPTRDEIAAAKQAVGWRLVELRPEPLAVRKLAAGVEINLNALVEGWALDRLAALLQSRGSHSFLIELGGEFKAAGQRGDGRAWQIGLENPHEPGILYATVQVADAAVATSGDYRQARLHAGKSYSHILDPRTGAPIEHGLSAVTVLCEDAMTADGWATALMVLGPIEGRKLADEHRLSASFVYGSQKPLKVELSRAAEGKVIVAMPPLRHSLRRVVIVGSGATILLIAVLVAVEKIRKRRRLSAGKLSTKLEASLHAGS